MITILLIFLTITWGVYYSVLRLYGKKNWIQSAKDSSKKIYIILQVIWTLIKQKIAPVKNFDQVSLSSKKYLKIPYVYNNQKYFYLIKIPRGKAPIKMIEDENGKNITEVILPYLGPNMDCSNLSLKPEDFGYDSIKITSVFDHIIDFQKTDTINM
jgi:hypothetical protein